jgi:hypothetical protein
MLDGTSGHLGQIWTRSEGDSAKNITTRPTTLWHKDSPNDFFECSTRAWLQTKPNLESSTLPGGEEKIRIARTQRLLADKA